MLIYILRDGGCSASAVSVVMVGRLFGQASGCSSSRPTEPGGPGGDDLRPALHPGGATPTSAASLNLDERRRAAGRRLSQGAGRSGRDLPLRWCRHRLRRPLPRLTRTPSASR